MPLQTGQTAQATRSAQSEESPISIEATQVDASAPAAAGAEAPALVPRSQPLPQLRTPLTPTEALDRLGLASRRGRLPGFEPAPKGGDTRRFKAAAFGHPFDREILGAISPDPEGGSVVEFRTRLLVKAPLIYLVSIVVSIWPGLPLVDALIPASWGWWPTWWWYLPLCVLPLPFLPRMWRRSEAVAHDEAHKTVRKIGAELGAEVIA